MLFCHMLTRALRDAASSCREAASFYALRDALEKLALTQLHGSLFGIGSRDAERDAEMWEMLQG